MVKLYLKKIIVFSSLHILSFVPINFFSSESESVPIFPQHNSLCSEAPIFFPKIMPAKSAKAYLWSFTELYPALEAICVQVAV